MNRLIQLLKKSIIQLPLWIFGRLCPINKKKVVVSSYYGKGFGDNPRYIVEALKSKYPDIRIIWGVTDTKSREGFPEWVETCKYNGAKYVFHMATAKFWIDNCRKGFVMFKRREQIYIQTWHGFALKRIEKDAAESLNDGYVSYAIKDSKNIDHIISCSSFMTEIYRKAFWYDGEILELGAPRNDVIINKGSECREKVYNALGISPNRKTVMYAPTFRVDYSIDAYKIEYERLIAACEKRFGGEFVALVRLHPNVSDKASELLEYNNKILNASLYPDMQELLSACDIVISDYSSLMFDFALSGKPCFQFATDIGAYKSDRNFYFELDRLPFSLATDNDELEQNVLNFDSDSYGKSLGSFYSDCGMICDGKASERCADLMISKI